MTFVAPMDGVDVVRAQDVSRGAEEGKQAVHLQREEAPARDQLPSESESSLSNSNSSSNIWEDAQDDTAQREAVTQALRQIGPASLGAIKEHPKSFWSIIPTSHADKVLERFRPAMPTQKELEASPHYPVVVTPNPAEPGYTFNGKADVRQHLDLNGPEFAIDSDIFKGKVIIHMKGLPTTDKAVFDGKKRLVHVVAQGKFKRRIRAVGVCTGQEFNIPLVANGGAVVWILDQILNACAKVFSRTTVVDAHANDPSFYNPLIAACQLMNVARDGEEPDMWTAEEDCRLMHPALADAKGRPMAAEKRRKWCDEGANVEDLYLDPDLVYTFHLWQHMMDCATYKLNIGFMAVDLCMVVSSQPLKLFIKDLATGDYAYSALVWHERLLWPDEHAEKQKELAKSKGGALTRLGKGFKNMFTA